MRVARTSARDEMDNAAVASVLDEIADLLEIQNQSSFRVRAYRNAARRIESLGEQVEPLSKRGVAALAELPGIGKDLAGKIVEICETGTHSMIAELAATIPQTVVLMMRIPGVGPKRAKLLYETLGLTSIEALAEAARSGKLDGIRGFGPTLQRKILEGTGQYTRRAVRRSLAEADAFAAPLLAWLRGARGALRVETAGSLRRRKDTVGDLDVLVASRDPARIAERFVKYPEIEEVLAHGEGKCAVLLKGGFQADLRVVAPESFGSALQYFTGSKSHNIAIRTLGIKAGLKINEYGVFRGTKRVGGESEEEVFAAVGLPFIPPELREDRGEIAAARKGLLPSLVTLPEIRGDLRVQSLAMVEGSAARGYEYVAFTERLDRAGHLALSRRIGKLRKSVAIAVLHGADVDILEDGSLAIDDGLGCDLVAASVRGALDLPEKKMTERVLRAMRDPRVNVLSQPSDPYALDFAEIARAAADLGVILDARHLSDAQIRVARDAGALVSVSPEPPSAMRYAVDQARRGWCAAKDVANTRSLAGLRKLLARHGHLMARAAS
ncbi:MAG: helix-hairpin-helix domain-containing protein [Polyangiales bacterium]